MDIKIIIDGKEYTLEEVEDLKKNLLKLLPVKEYIPYYPPVYIPTIWNEPYYTAPTYTITTSPGTVSSEIIENWG